MALLPPVIGLLLFFRPQQIRNKYDCFGLRLPILSIFHFGTGCRLCRRRHTGAEHSGEDGLLVKWSPGGLTVIMGAVAGLDKTQAFYKAKFYRSGVRQAAGKPA